MERVLHFQMCGRLVFGLGSLAELPDAVARLGGQRVLLVTDRGVVAAGLCEQVESVLSQAGVTVERFDQVEPDPRMEIAEACRDAARAAACEVLIGLGGGSSLDIAKVAAVLVTNQGPLSELVGIDRVPRPGLPTVMVPTTAGTGSEVTPIAVLSDKAEQLKKGLVSDHLYPRVALVDPSLTASLPPRVTAYTGVDALTHAIEAYTNKYAHPLVDTFALEAVRLIGVNLRRAVSCGDDSAARTGMSLGSLYGGLCLGSVNTAAVHALAYPLGGMFDLPHGLANSVLLPHVMAYNLVSDLAKHARLAEALGEATGGLSQRAAAARSVEAVSQLCRDVGVTDRLRDLGIPESALADMAPAAMKVTRLLNNNPRVMTEQDALGIYQAAY
jgi:alcohol dehydrogenase class IV